MTTSSTARQFAAQRLSRSEFDGVLRLTDGWLRSRSRAQRQAALILLETAVAAGNHWAAWKIADCHRYGVGVQKSLRRALPWYRIAAQMGSAGAIGSLGYLAWQEGRTPAALRLYRKAAAMGDADAQHNLGLALIRRPRVRDRREGFLLLRSAAKQGHVGALYQIAACNFYGTGTRSNAAVALRYFERAAKAGSRRAQRFLKSLNGKQVVAP